MKLKLLRGVVFVLVWILPACAGVLPTPTPLPATATVTQTATITPTIVWFPPTDTPQPVPTRTVAPTPDYRPAQGALVLSDAFENAEDWLTGSTAAGNIAITNQKLTIAVQQAQGALLTYTLTNASYQNFYLSVAVSPSLCRGQDAYGVLLRLNSQWDYYRFLLRCDGYARVERVRGGQTTLMQDWTNVGVNSGALASLNLGVWAYGTEMRFFVNDYYLYTTADPVFPDGRVGFFARASGDSALTVTFSNLSIRDLNPQEIPPTPTWTPVN